MPVYVYDTIQPSVDPIPSYQGPLVEYDWSGLSLSKAADASAVFGNNSVLSAAQETTFADLTSTSLSNYMSLTDNIFFKAVVIALFLYYCYVVFHFRDCIATLFKVVKVKFDGSTLLNDSTYIFSLFLRTMTVIWFAVCGIAFVKLADIAAGDEIASSLPQWAVYLLIIPATAIMPIVMLFQKAVIRMIDNVILSAPFTNLLRYIKVLFTAAAVLTIAPTVLLLALYNGELQNALLYIIVAESVTVIFMWLYKTYMLFIEQNVSILHWILYLCAIEIFPFTLLILISLRLA